MYRLHPPGGGDAARRKKQSRFRGDGNSVQDWMVDEMDRIQARWKFYYHHLPNGYHGKPKTG